MALARSRRGVPFNKQKIRAQPFGNSTPFIPRFEELGRVKQARIFAEEATRELRAYGQDNFELAQAAIDLGNVRRLERRYTEAESLTQEGINRYARAQGEDHPNVAFGLTSLATVYYDAGQFDIAEGEARKAMKIVEKLPKNHYYAGTYIALGMILNKAGRSHEAEPMLREGLAVRLQKAPRQSNYGAIALGALGECLLAQKRYAEAEPLLLESHQIFQGVHVRDSPLLSQARERLRLLYTDWGKLTEMQKYQR